MLSTRDRRNLVRWVTSGETETATQAARKLSRMKNTTITAQTVRNSLKKSGLKSFVKTKKPLLRGRHKKARYDFAFKYRHWTTYDWKRVIFSDESKVNRLGSDGRNWTWSRRREDVKVTPTLKFGGGSVMVWGCITAQGVGYLCKIDGRMDAELYTTILSGEFMQTLEFYGMDREDVVFQQDNDPKHTSRLATQWFQDNSVEVLDWPPQSPDLNPIENVWPVLKSRLNAHDEEPTSIAELWERIQTEWENIPSSLCVDVIDSMPQRIAQVLEAKGGYTKY